MDIMNKMNFFKYIAYINAALLMYSCNNRSNVNVDDKKILIDSVFKKLQTLEVDSLRKINAFERGSVPLYVIRCYNNDSCKHIQILLMRNKNREIAIKLSNRLTTIDSLEFYYHLNSIGFSKERVIYCFKVMEALSIEEINTSCDYKMLSIKKNHLEFYYLFDTTLNKKYNSDTTLIKLGNNWWVEK